MMRPDVQFVSSKNNQTFFLTRIIVVLIILLMLIFAGCGEDKSTQAVKPRSTQTADGYGIIVAMGDSLTAGLGVDPEDAYPSRLERKLRSDGYRYNVVNAGVSGETSSGALSRIEWVIASLKPDIVILETGANDGLRGIPPDTLAHNLDQLLTILKQNHIEVVLAGMKMLPNLGPEYVKAFGRIYPLAAREHDVILMPFFLEGVAGRRDLNQADGIHPTSNGYAVIVSHLYPFVVDAIEKHRSHVPMETQKDEKKAANLNGSITEGRS